jgi:putative ABC transport system permease protein
MPASSLAPSASRRSPFIAELVLALRLLRRDQRAGELTLIATALVLAVASVTTVGFFTDRVQRALTAQANTLLGADLVIASGRPFAAGLEAEARAQGLAATHSLRFPSMVVRGEQHALASVRAVEEGYPLRGEVRIARAPFGPDARAPGIPPPGTAWVDERLFSELGVSLGERIELGQIALEVTAILTREPDVSIGFIAANARLLVNAADIPATGLIQPGSRVSYRLQIAGAAAALDTFRAWVVPRLTPGERLEDVRDARPELRTGLARAERFLKLASLLAVILAAVAIGLAARRFLQRHLDQCALMRCFGASQSTLVRIYILHFALLGVVASLVGCALGVGAQALLAHSLTSAIAVALPPPGGASVAFGIATGFILLLAFALPPLAGLRRVTPLRVLRRELGAPPARRVVGHASGLLAIAALITWQSQDLRLAAVVLGGFAVALLVGGGASFALLSAARAWPVRGPAWGSGIASLRARPLASVVQVIALAAGIMALLVLTFVRDDLVTTWRASLPPDAPNRFVVNIQPDQVEAVREFLHARNGREPVLYPMVRGRLVSVNERRVSSADYVHDRARRLVDREFNLSWAARMPADNRVSAGRWWDAEPGAAPQFSVEDGLARTLGIGLGDTLTFDVAGVPVAAEVTSLRKVEWDTLNVNFFVIAAPGVLDTHPTTFITAFHLAERDAAALRELVRAFPNLVLIDVARIMGELQGLIERAARAVQLVFLFTLFSGLIVLYAAIAAGEDERLARAVIMRTLGATRSQLYRSVLSEFVLIGLLAGVLAAAGATAFGYALATYVLDLPYAFSGPLWAAGTLGGALLVSAAGYLGTRGVIKVSPIEALREHVQ